MSNCEKYTNTHSYFTFSLHYNTILVKKLVVVIAYVKFLTPPESGVVILPQKFGIFDIADVECGKPPKPAQKLFKSL